VEGDVVLTHEVVGPGSRVIPPFLPLLGLAYVVSPLDAGSEIAHHRFEPDIQSLLTISLQWQRDAPLNVTGDGTALEALLEVAPRKVDDGVSPVIFIIFQIRTQPIREFGKVKEEVLRPTDDGGRAVSFAARINEFRGIKELTAVVALITTGTIVATIGTDAFHIAVGQEASFCLRIELPLRLLVKVAAVQAGQKDVLGNAMMIFSVSVGEQVITDTNLLKRFQKAGVETLKYFTRADTFGIGTNGDRRTVRVRPGDHKHVVPVQPLVTGEDVGWHVRASQVPDV